MGFRLAYLDLTLAYSEDQLDRRNFVSPNLLPFLYITVIIIIDMAQGRIAWII